MRYWSTEFIIKEFDKLLNMGVRTIRIVDEMFLLNPKYYVPLCEKLSERNTNDQRLGAMPEYMFPSFWPVWILMTSNECLGTEFNGEVLITRVPN